MQHDRFRDSAAHPQLKNLSLLDEGSVLYKLEISPQKVLILDEIHQERLGNLKHHFSLLLGLILC